MNCKSIPEQDLQSEYLIIKELGKGDFSRIHLATHIRTRFSVALKSVHKKKSKLKDFLNEFHYNYFLSPHRNILTCYQVAFQTPDAFVYAQEIAPFGDLNQFMRGNELDENRTKSITKQVASALDFMHSKSLVHRDVKPANVLVFCESETLVKLADFGHTCPVGALVKKSNECPSNSPPEVFDAVPNEGYHVETSGDSWQLAMLVCHCLRLRLPWEKADIGDRNYAEFLKWQKRKVQKTPRYFKGFTTRLNRWFRKMLESKPERRAPVGEIYKYLNDQWCANINDNSGNGGLSKSDSSKSKESDDNKLENSLIKFGIDVCVDRTSRKNRVKEWIVGNSG